MAENKFFDKINLEHYHRYVSGMIKRLSDNIDERIDEKFKNFIEDNVSDGEILDARGGERTLGDRLNKFDEKYSEVSSQLAHDVNKVIKLKSTGSDDSSLLQEAINKAKDTGYKIVLEDKVFILNNPIIMYSNVLIEGISDTLIDCTGATCEKLITIKHYAMAHNSGAKVRHIFKNIMFKGYNSYFPWVCGNLHNNTTLFYVHCSHIRFENINVYGFNKVFEYNSDSYLVSVYNSLIHHNNYGVYFDATNKSNLGERITFFDCTFGNNNIAIYNNLGMLSFNECSIDYNKVIIEKNKTDVSGINSGRTIFTNCHLEDDTNHIEDEVRIYNDGNLHFLGCQIWSNATTWCNNNSHQLKLTACDIRGGGLNPLITGNTPSVENLTYIQDYKAVVVHKNLSLVDNSFANITTHDGTSSIENSYLKMVSNQYTSCYVYFNKINVNGMSGRRIVGGFTSYSSKAASNFKTKILFYKENGELLETVSQDFLALTSEHIVDLKANIPNGSNYCVLKVGVEGIGTSSHMFVKNDLYLTII